MDLEPTRACVVRCGATLKIDAHCAGLKCAYRLKTEMKTTDNVGCADTIACSILSPVCTTKRPVGLLPIVRARQVVRASKNDLLHNTHLVCLVLCYLLKDFFNSVKGPFRSFHLFPEGCLYILPNSHFFVSKLSKPLYSASFLEKVFPHPAQIWFFSHHLPHPSAIRPLSTTYLHCTFDSGFSPFACRCLLKHF